MGVEELHIYVKSFQEISDLIFYSGFGVEAYFFETFFVLLITI